MGRGRHCRPGLPYGSGVAVPGVRLLRPVPLWGNDPLLGGHGPAGPAPAHGAPGHPPGGQRLFPQPAKRRRHELLWGVLLFSGQPLQLPRPLLGEGPALPAGKPPGAPQALPGRGRRGLVFPAGVPLPGPGEAPVFRPLLRPVRVRAPLLPKSGVAGHALPVPPGDARLLPAGVPGPVPPVPPGPVRRPGGELLPQLHGPADPGALRRAVPVLLPPQRGARPRRREAGGLRHRLPAPHRGGVAAQPAPVPPLRPHGKDPPGPPAHRGIFHLLPHHPAHAPVHRRGGVSAPPVARLPGDAQAARPAPVPPAHSPAPGGGARQLPVAHGELPGLPRPLRVHPPVPGPVVWGGCAGRPGKRLRAPPPAIPLAPAARGLPPAGGRGRGLAPPLPPGGH